VDPHEFSHGPGRSDSQEGRPEEPKPPPEDPIMARLPKSRPKRTSPVRERAARPRRAPAAKPRVRRPSPPSPGRGVDAGRDPAVFGPDEDAPGLPRLALDGAIEAIKLPVKVGANLTFRGIDAVTKGLRRR
jgi:hypothetical protein